ncbi:DUF7114 family protein [Haloarcula onubensis]|uniref:Uncharacterized protein n=1 Tax=Haloarcula onubensis TaxID=2950539 RepID=A0ABU2FNR8_9EURY|nr:hypothetical protein [Halomicroarcula sp. S3CR25-11]MDS0282406.1 hypothetical protein [Halomicroarcula sp. S3CR25-11]
MEEVAAVRRAALAGVDDVEPERLRDRITARLDDASLAPGVLTLVAATATRGHTVDSDDDRAAGVQLIYEGLALTRRLAHDDPWTTGDRDAADLDILIADILVSRGFYLLAHTEAADAAVDVVREFGKDQTELRTTGDADFDGNLEADVCELAVVAGVTAAGHTPTPELKAVGADLAAGGLPENATLLNGEVADRLSGHTNQAAADP